MACSGLLDLRYLCCKLGRALTQHGSKQPVLHRLGVKLHYRGLCLDKVRCSRSRAGSLLL